MNRIGRILLILLGVILLLVVILIVAGNVALRRPFPQTDGVVAIGDDNCPTTAAQTANTVYAAQSTLCTPAITGGLQAQVDIYRDEYGIAHIYADNLEDLLFAQGYVHAQDRFWQMEFWRHTGLGRISEIVGDATLGNDKFIRTAGWNRMAEDTVAYYQENEPEYYKLLEAYSAGVNAYLSEQGDNISINRTILSLVGEPWEIEPWTPVNTVSWGVVMSFTLADEVDAEKMRAAFMSEFGEDLYYELIPPYPYERRPVIAPTDEQVNVLGEMGGLDTAVNWPNVNSKIIGEIPDVMGKGPFVGSNNWVIGGEHTDTGLPLLADDMHLGIQMPSIWYEVGLHMPGMNVVGYSFAGVPGVIAGHNDAIAWGLTNTGADVQDLFIEKINPDNPDQYEFMGQWKDMEIVTEVIKVNGGEDVVLPVRITRHGPIVSEPDEENPAQDVLTMRWAAQDPSRVLQAVLLLNQAQNYEDFREALRFWDIPSQNVVYADVEGNIAYQMPGRTPVRKNGFGYVPSPGWTGEYEWEGWIPYEELPALFNPEKGYISTANNAIVDEDYPHYIKRDWNNGDRGQRIMDMIEEMAASGQPITKDDIGRMHSDSKSLLAATYTPLLLQLQSDDPQVQQALEILSAWDLQERRDSTATSIFELFNAKLYPAIVADEIGAEYAAEMRDTIFLHNVGLDPDSHWWDDVSTPEVETQADILLLALTQGLAELETLLGGSMDNWTWDRLHTATFPSDPLGQSGIGPIETLVNRGPVAVDGGASIVNAMSWSPDDPALVTWIPSMRMIVDMADFDASRAVNPTGQSGHPGSPHYDDMIPLWQNGEYHPMWFSEEQVLETAVDHLILQPSQ